MAGNPLDLKSRDSTVKDDDDVAPTKNRVADPGSLAKCWGYGVLTTLTPRWNDDDDDVNLDWTDGREDN